MNIDNYRSAILHAPNNSTEDDQLNPSAPPAEDNSSDENVECPTAQHSTSTATRMTRSTADPDKLSPYVYDTLPLEKCLSQIIEEKRWKKVEEKRKRLQASTGTPVKGEDIAFSFFFLH